MNRHEPDTGEYDLQALQRQVLPESGPAPPSARIAVGASTHPGLLRPNNEDHFIVGRLSRQATVLATNLPAGYVPKEVEQSAHALAVADGMGGAAAGEVASALALSLGTSLTIEAARWHLELDAPARTRLSERVNEFFQIIDRALTAHAQRDPGLSGMGTTLTVAYTVNFDALIFHVGDSRAYVFQQQELRQVTRDETIAQAMCDAGAIPAESVANHPMRHVLTRAMGAGTGCGAAVSQVHLEPGACLVLCTDGLSDMIDDRTIARLLEEHQDPQRACDALIDAALAAGGRDNVTVIVARYAEA
jgi:protein phosphatase